MGIAPTRGSSRSACCAASSNCWFTPASGGADGHAARARLRAEAQVLHLLAHAPGVPRLLHIDGGAGVMVQQRAPGVVLGKAMVTLPRGVGCWALVALAAQRIVDAVHRAGVLHGDQHPDNIVFDAATGSVALIDCGLVVPMQGHRPADDPVQAMGGHGPRLARARSLRAVLGRFGPPGWAPDEPGNNTAELRRRHREALAQTHASPG
jgi:serine/threonine protein kinase